MVGLTVMKPLPPETTSELLSRVKSIAGLTLGELAHRTNSPIPGDLRQHKGWVGQFLETFLGADSGNLAVPDFSKLNIELKTIPINKRGLPQESTYITVVPMLGAPNLAWESSEVRLKLQHVLWLPVEADQHLKLADRRVGYAVLWRMPTHIEAILRADWQELMEYVLLGRLAKLNASIGQYLHVRPKAANSRILTQGLDNQGNKILTLPRGFYLRPQLTQQIILKKC